MREAGAAVDMERYIPHLYDTTTKDGVTKQREAIMDVVIHFPGSWTNALVDVSIRCPHAERYKNASTEVSIAALAGEREKAERYGQEVQPLIFETYGRLGSRSLTTLQSLADSSAVAGKASTRRLAGWRKQLERAVVWSAAESVLLSLGAGAHHFLYSSTASPPD